MSYLIENRHLGVKRCKHGIFAYNRNDTLIGKSLDQYGEWCEYEIDLLRQFIKPGDRVIDVGANIGTHTIAFANIVGPTGKVIAFEPQPELFGLLVTNVTLNCLTNVRAEQCVIGESSGSVEISALPPPDTSFNFGAQPLGLNTPKKYAVQAMTIDLRRLSPGPALIKIDAEGMEAEIIRGAANTILQYKPVLYVENNGDDSAALYDVLGKIGYVGYWSIGPYFSPYNFFGNKTHQWPGVVASANVICLPSMDERKPKLPLLSGPEDNYTKVLASHPHLRSLL
jgi:FkbM family methyltransferase